MRVLAYTSYREHCDLYAEIDIILLSAHLVFLELDIHQPHLDFKILDGNNNEVIPRTFDLQLLNKQWVYTTIFNKERRYWLIHHTKNIMIYTLKFLAKLLLTAVRSNLHRSISFYYLMSPQWFIRLVNAPVKKILNLYILTSQRVLIQLMILMQRWRYQSYNKGKTGNHLKLKT